MIAEIRAAQLDLAARAKFAQPKQVIHETRAVIADLAGEPEQQKRSTNPAALAAALKDGFVEVG